MQTLCGHPSSQKSVAIVYSVVVELIWDRALFLSLAVQVGWLGRGLVKENKWFSEGNLQKFLAIAGGRARVSVGERRNDSCLNEVLFRKGVMALSWRSVGSGTGRKKKRKRVFPEDEEFVSAVSSNSRPKHFAPQEWLAVTPYGNF